MKQKIPIVIGLFIILCPLLLRAETASVITKENAIREYCKFFAPVKARIRYLDTLEILSSEGDWFRVKFKAVEGCIHRGAIEKKVVTGSGLPFSRKSPGLSESEAALAGKGFNPQVESSFKQKHPEMKYHLVDTIEKFTMSDRDLSQFMTTGGLKLP